VVEDVCVAVAPGYAEFLALAEGRQVDWMQRPRGARPDPVRLLDAARKLASAPVSVAAVDMPLSKVPITGRRIADNALTSAFIRMKCGVHTPNPERPGEAGRAISEGFAACGFELATTAPHGAGPYLIEVYPHAAIIALLGLKERLEYKVARARQFWPECDAAGRAAKIKAALKRILRALRREIRNIPSLPVGGTAAELKPFEDAIDALVCCWVGMQFLAGRARGYGDATAAIWAPKYDAT
jgi:predicted RNase H-like nuclease